MRKAVLWIIFAIFIIQIFVYSITSQRFQLTWSKLMPLNVSLPHLDFTNVFLQNTTSVLSSRFNPELGNDSNAQANSTTDVFYGLSNVSQVSLSFWKSENVSAFNLANVSTKPFADSPNMNHTSGTMILCPVVPPHLAGTIQVDLEPKSFEFLNSKFSHLGKVGHFVPANCTARHKVAIIIPFRGREAQLSVLLNSLHQLLPKQQLDYQIFVVEEAGNQTFNRGKLMNIGFVEAAKLYDWQCFVFHDVDLIPEDDRNIYSCPDHPRHLSAAIDKHNYRLPYYDIFGGAGVLTKSHFLSVNGFSNDYWGWGGEDDDMRQRYWHYDLQPEFWG